MATLYFPDGKSVETDGSGPRVIEDNTVQYWCHHTMELKATQVSKALKLVRAECLRYAGDGVFLCLPLNTREFVVHEGVRYLKEPFERDYNTRVYSIRKEGSTFVCNCQGWHTRRRKGDLVEGGANCAHVLGLYYAFKMGRFGKAKGLKGGAHVPGD